MSAHNVNIDDEVVSDDNSVYNDNIDDEVVSDDNNVYNDNIDGEVVSDDESVQRLPTRSRSAFKRRRIGSDDEEDEKPATDDEDDEVNQNDADDDSKTHMNNKKLKRVSLMELNSINLLRTLHFPFIMLQKCCIGHDYV